MTWGGLVWRNLLRRPVRTGLTAAGVSLGVGLIVALLSITNGAKETAAQLIHIGRADFGLFQAGTADLTQSPLPESMAKEGAADHGGAATARIFLFNTRRLLVFGDAKGDFPAQRMVVGHRHQATGDEALLGDRPAGRLGVHPGDGRQLGKRSSGVAGLY